MNFAKVVVAVSMDDHMMGSSPSGSSPSPTNKNENNKKLLVMDHHDGGGGTATRIGLRDDTQEVLIQYFDEGFAGTFGEVLSLDQNKLRSILADKNDPEAIIERIVYSIKNGKTMSCTARLLTISGEITEFDVGLIALRGDYSSRRKDDYSSSAFADNEMPPYKKMAVEEESSGAATTPIGETMILDEDSTEGGISSSSPSCRSASGHHHHQRDSSGGSAAIANAVPIAVPILPSPKRATTTTTRFGIISLSRSATDDSVMSRVPQITLMDCSTGGSCSSPPRLPGDTTMTIPAKKEEPPMVVMTNNDSMVPTAPPSTCSPRGGMADMGAAAAASYIMLMMGAAMPPSASSALPPPVGGRG